MRAAIFGIPLVVAISHFATAQTIDMSGAISYSRLGSSINLSVGRIENFRSPTSISGTLALQLWATSGPYAGGVLTGYKLAEARLDELQGGYFFSNVSRNTAFAAPVDGTYQVVLVLGEWSTFSYMIVDWHNFTPLATFTDAAQKIRSLKLIPPKRSAKSGQTVKLALAIQNATPFDVTVPVSFTSSAPGVAVPEMNNLFVRGKRTARFTLTVVVDPFYKGTAVVGAAVGFLSTSTTSVLTVK